MRPSKPVRPKVDSGYNMRKFLETHDENRLNTRFKRKAKCQKISIKRFIPLLRRSLGNIPPSSSSSSPSAYTSSPRSLVTDLEGSIDFTQNTEMSLSDNPWAGAPNTDILVLDVRDPHDFNSCHIIGSYSYPQSYIRRSTNYFTPEIFKIKNKPDAIIVLYDLDEVDLIAESTAVEFLDKGVENVVVLKGGLVELARKESGFLSNRDFPAEWIVKPVEAKPARRPPRSVDGVDYQRKNVKEVKQFQASKREERTQKETDESRAKERQDKLRNAKLKGVESKLFGTTASAERKLSARKDKPEDGRQSFRHGRTDQSADVLKSRTTPRGQVPAYLKKKQEQELKEEQRLQEEELHEEMGNLRLVGEEERLSMLHQLNDNKSVTEKLLGDLEVKASAGNEGYRRELMDKLTLIEDAIALFSKKEVYIADD
ncbi:hypothetical protein GEMRC1_004802 [Eukaryota sp. GEM-RC1]